MDFGIFKIFFAELYRLKFKGKLPHFGVQIKVDFYNKSQYIRK